MSALLFFEGFHQMDDMTEMRVKMRLDVLGLTQEDMESFPKPDYSQIVSHLKSISDFEVRRWVINNTYSPVLKSNRIDALRAYRTFCSDLGWDANEIKECMDLIEDLEGIKPIEDSEKRYSPTDTGVKSSGSIDTGVKNSSSGCLSIIALVIVSTALFAFAFII